MTEKPITPAVARRAIGQALQELSGKTSEPMEPRQWWQAIGEAMVRYLGPAMGMTTNERWHRLAIVELWILMDSLEERAAIVGWM